MRTRIALIITAIFAFTLSLSLMPTASSGSTVKSVRTAATSHTFQAYVRQGTPPYGPTGAVGYLYGANTATYPPVGAVVSGKYLQTGTTITDEYAAVGQRYLVLSLAPTGDSSGYETVTIVATQAPQIAQSVRHPVAPVKPVVPRPMQLVAPVAETTTTTIAPAPVVTQAPVVSTSGSSVWDCIIAHESGGNPSAVNPSSGAGGLFQFLPSTWANLGEPGLPENASVGAQWAAAEKLQAVEGWSPWVGDGCTPIG